MLKGGDKLQIGDRILRIEVGAPRSNDDVQDLSRSKKFMGGVVAGSGDDKKDEAASAAAAKENDEDAKLTVEELMDKVSSSHIQIDIHCALPISADICQYNT